MKYIENRELTEKELLIIEGGYHLPPKESTDLDSINSGVKIGDIKDLILLY